MKITDFPCVQAAMQDVVVNEVIGQKKATLIHRIVDAILTLLSSDYKKERRKLSISLPIVMGNNIDASVKVNETGQTTIGKGIFYY